MAAPLSGSSVYVESSNIASSHGDQAKPTMSGSLAGHVVTTTTISTPSTSRNSILDYRSTYPEESAGRALQTFLTVGFVSADEALAVVKFMTDFPINYSRSKKLTILELANIASFSEKLSDVKRLFHAIRQIDCDDSETLPKDRNAAFFRFLKGAQPLNFSYAADLIHSPYLLLTPEKVETTVATTTVATTTIPSGTTARTIANPNSASTKRKCIIC